jgi:branched-subunit amino acid aminotransferase/4-amino-4-deoxychorismate lyase
VPSARTLWIDGALVRGERATFSAFDRGARDGEGLFETLRVYEGRPFGWDRHLERLVISAAELGFPVPPAPERLRAALDEVLAAEGLRDATARVTVTRGIPGRPSRAGAWVEVQPIDARLWRGVRTGRARAIVSGAAFAPGSLGRHKTTSRLAYQLARDEARAAGADEALLLDGTGQLLEGATSNVFVVHQGRARTPPLSLGILPGVTRALVIELAREIGLEIGEAPVADASLAGADEVFLTNSVQEIVPLAALGERNLPSRFWGERLLERYRARVAREPR